jgi:hypothetical protein
MTGTFPEKILALQPDPIHHFRKVTQKPEAGHIRAGADIKIRHNPCGISIERSHQAGHFFG